MVDFLRYALKSDEEGIIEFTLVFMQREESDRAILNHQLLEQV